MVAANNTLECVVRIHETSCRPNVLQVPPLRRARLSRHSGQSLLAVDHKKRVQRALLVVLHGLPSGERHLHTGHMQSRRGKTKALSHTTQQAQRQPACPPSSPQGAALCCRTGPPAARRPPPPPQWRVPPPCPTRTWAPAGGTRAQCPQQPEAQVQTLTHQSTACLRKKAIGYR